jgi:uracil-DNA glycosylase family 4
MELFTPEEVEENTQIYHNKNVDQDVNCLKCGLYKRSKSPKLDYTGKGGKGALLLCEASGEHEDIRGTQLVGPVGQFFRQKLRHANLSLDRDFWYMNSCGCRPHKDGKNRTPTTEEISYCRPKVFKAIEDLKPKFIWLSGGVALESFFGDQYMNSKSFGFAISKWRGLCIPDQRTGSWVLPIFHPSYCYRDQKEKSRQSVFERDILNSKKVLSLKPVEIVDYNSMVEPVFYYHNVIQVLKKIKKEAKTLFFDYETNCLKPQVPGARIATISACYKYDKVYSFPFQYASHFTDEEQKVIKKLWAEILLSDHIVKEAQNMKFEHNWSYYIIGVEPVKWGWDTMLASHILDNRRGITNLDFQSYINLGVMPYNEVIRPYLEASGSNKLNNIMQAPLKELLTYGGKDSLFGKHIKKKQISKFRKTGKLIDAYKLFHEGTDSMAFMERSGIKINEEYYVRKDYYLENQIIKAEKKITESKEAKKFEKKRGRPLKIKKDISNDDLRFLFYEVMGKNTNKYTASGLPSIDEEVLRKFKDPIADAILKRRKALKVQGTYVHQFLRESIQGHLWPFYDLVIPISFRGSSSKPNFTNIPKRDPEAKKITRSGIVPSEGNQIGDVDFSSIEVCTSACYHKDPKMIKYLTDPSSDMHRDSACDLWMLPTDQIAKKIRFFAKNQWVFAQFYGSYYGNCAKNLWETCIKELNLKTSDGTPLKEHLRQEGITKYHTFEEHCKTVEDTFWKRFKVYKKWKDDNYNSYLKKGFIETFFGFRFTGLMNYNETSNYPIQGTAFHILLWTLNKTVKKARQEKWISKILGHIHDQLVFDFKTKEVDHIFNTVNQIATVQTRKNFKWITVPLSLEASIAEVGKSWFDTKEVKIG